jgi:hypothetical protein
MILMASRGKRIGCVIWESNPGLPDVTWMATENFTTKPITLIEYLMLLGLLKIEALNYIKKLKSRLRYAGS